MQLKLIVDNERKERIQLKYIGDREKRNPSKFIGDRVRKK